MNIFTVREFDYLFSGQEGENSCFGQRQGFGIPSSAYAYLERILSRDDEKEHSEDHRFFLKHRSWNAKPALQIQSFVGVLQTPCGTQIEILPKIADRTAEGNKDSRAMLRRMLRHLRDAKFKLGGDAHLQEDTMHLLELFIRCFLHEVNMLVKKGIRSDYVVREENQVFLKGKLLINQHIRVNAVQQQRFYVAYDEYLPDRPENRLIHTALEKVSRISKSNNNQRLCRELMFVFNDVPCSGNIRQDFSQCKFNRGMMHYRHAMDWCRMILKDERTVPSAGKTQTISILFPMEKIFEDYVASMLRQHLPDGYQVTAQASREYLCVDPKRFNLKPDILIQHDGQYWIADTKWKTIDQNDGKNHGISQGDMYQLYAYGKKYKCRGLFLIYPETENFNKGIRFELEQDKELSLACLPFDCSSKVTHERFVGGLKTILDGATIRGLA